MPFTSLLIPKKEQVYTLLGKYPVYRGQNNLIILPGNSEKSVVLTQIVKQMLDNDKRVLYVNTSSDEQTLLTNLLSVYTKHSVRDLNNSNYLQKQEVQDDIELLSEKFEDNLKIRLFSFPSTVSEVLSEVKSELDNEFDLVIIDHLPGSKDSVKEDGDYAKSINIAFEALSEVVKLTATPFITLETTSTQKKTPAYFLNQKNAFSLFVDEMNRSSLSKDFTKDFKNIFIYSSLKSDSLPDYGVHMTGTDVKPDYIFVNPPYGKYGVMEVKKQEQLKGRIKKHLEERTKQVRFSTLINQAKKLIISEKGKQEGLEILKKVVSELE